MAVVGDSPVVVFCADLKRRWQASGRDLAGVAREVQISRAQLYAILNGEIKRPPDFDDLVKPLILACGGTAAELAQWRRRHEVLVGVHAELRRRPAGRTGTPWPTPAQLPVDVDRFTGRAAALAALDEASARVVLITGTAGVGKTALAVHWAHGAAGDFPDGQLYVNLRGFDRSQEVMDPAEAIRGFLEALGTEPHRIPRGRDAQAALYRSLSAGRRMLVVLDNARDADQVRPLLAASPTVRSVVTSRGRLTALVAETGAQPLELDLPDQVEAIALLNRRVGASPQDARDDAAAVVAACGRLPLALALVAARARQTGFPLATLAAELRRPGPALDEVRAVFAWSYRLLSPPAARLFRLLGLVSGADIAAAAVTALAGVPHADVDRMLRELTEANLVIEHAPGRYQLHDLLCVYAGELAQRSDTSDERRAALTRLLDHYSHTAYQAELVLNPTRAPILRGLGSPGDGTGADEPLDIKEALEWMGTERAVLLSALRQAKDEGLDRHAWQLGWALDTFLYENNHWQDEGAAWAVALRAATALMDRSAAAHAHQFLAVVASRLDSFAEAREHMRQAVELSQAEADRASEAETLFRLSYVCWLQADHDGALHHAQQSLTLWAGLDHPVWEGKAGNAVGWYHAQLGDYHTALPHFERALALQQQAGDMGNQILALDNLGQAHHNLGNHEIAIGHYQHGLQLAHAMANPVMQAQLGIHLGDTYQSIGEHATARDHWQQAYEILMSVTHPRAADVRRKLETAP